MIKIKLVAIFIIFINLNSVLLAEIYTAYKVNGEIVTNIDIKKESQYLIALSNQLKNLNDKQVIKIAKDSLIREKIKKIELAKYFTLDQKNSFLDKIIKDFYIKLNLQNLEEFERYLKKYDMTIEEIKVKMEIETLWNKLIYDKYINQINIDEKFLKNKIIQKQKIKSEKTYLLSEILFEKSGEKTIIQLNENINKSIKEIGFENTANIFSISDSAKFGGKVGWIKEKDLSKKIYQTISNLEIGGIAKPIQVGSNYLILKINNIKSEAIKVDKKKELQRVIDFETNKQLSQFSIIYFNKIKINTHVEKL
jgi:peptidyl-prolyl cis-trans isomerase SurA